jgi:hypothetical protein
VVHLAFFSGDSEAWRLAHVHLLSEVAVEECGLYVHVVHLPSFLTARARRTRTDSILATGANASS